MVVLWKESKFFNVKSEILGSSRNREVVLCGGLLEQVLVFKCAEFRFERVCSWDLV